MSINCKIVILGESGVGKTCIMMRYNEDTFVDDHLITVAANYESKEVEVKGIKINIKVWDTCGNEQFRSISKIFYKGADIILLVYDITKQSSFDEIKNYWYNQIKEYAPKNISKTFLIFNNILFFY